MRGDDVQQGGMFSYVSLEARVPSAHPLRGMKALLDEALSGMSRDFDRVYASEGRPSIPPERLIRASTLQVREDPTDLERWFDCQKRLREARAARERPARDDKVVAAWNGLAISGLCIAGGLIGLPHYVDAAVAAGELLHRLHVVDGRLRRVSRDGVVGAPAGVLEDYGCVAAGFLDLSRPPEQRAHLVAAPAQRREE